jgi:hypothetical protein
MRLMVLTTTAMPNLTGRCIPKDKEKINSYKLTNECYALLNLVERVKVDERKQEEQKEQTTQRESRKQEQEESRSGFKVE